jgi:hypothetical protein
MLVLEDACAAYCYIGGFEPDLAVFSPGTLLLAHAIDAAIAAGRLEVDFLRGAEPYKYRFGARDRCNVCRVVSSSPAPYGVDRGPAGDVVMVPREEPEEREEHEEEDALLDDELVLISVEEEASPR